MAIIWNNMVVPQPFWDSLDKAIAANITPRGVFPYALAVAVAYYESGFNETIQSQVPNSSGPNGKEDSWGYFQLHRQGVGHGYSIAYLQNGDNNCRIAINEMTSRWLRTGNLYQAILPWEVRDMAYAAYQRAPIVSRSDAVPAPTPGNTTPPAPSTSGTDGGDSQPGGNSNQPPTGGTTGQVSNVSLNPFDWVKGALATIGLAFTKQLVALFGGVLILAGGWIIFSPTMNVARKAAKVLT